MRGRKNSATQLISVAILGAVLPLGIIPAVGQGLLILLISLSILIFSLILPDGIFNNYPDRLKYLLIRILILGFCITAMVYIRNISALHLSLPYASVTAIEGRIVFDSSFSGSGNHIMTVFIQQNENIFGQNATACGLVTAVGKQKAIITAGLKIRLYGHFSNGNMFLYDSIQVLERSRINDIREFIIPRLEKRILGNEKLSCNVLSTMLILGRGETYQCPVKDLALSCGCIHVLALSGMHLHAVTFPVRFIKNKKIKYMAKGILVGVFLFIAGPRSSLVRSAIFIMLSFLPIRERLVTTAVLQILIFPLSMANSGAVYGYISVFSLVLLAPYLTSFLSYSIGRPIGNSIGSSLAVLCVNAPLQIVLSGYWKPAAIIAGPATSTLAVLSMILGFAQLTFGQKKILNTLNNFVYCLMEKLLSFFSEFPDAYWKGYVLLVLTCILITALSALFHRHLKTSIVHNAKIK